MNRIRAYITKAAAQSQTELMRAFWIRLTRFVTPIFALCALVCLLAPISAVAEDKNYTCLVDDHKRPISFYYNCAGGDRGVIGDLTEVAFSQVDSTAYRIRVNAVNGGKLWTFGGVYEALGHPLADKRSVNPQALFHPMIKPEFQPRITGVRVKLSGATSPSGRADLIFRIELKGFDTEGNEVVRQNYGVVRTALLGGTFPKTFAVNLPATLEPVGLVNLILDHAVAGDQVDVDDVSLDVALTDQPARVRAVVLSLGMLLGNWNEATGMVDDRSNFKSGDFENVTATAKLAKTIALGIQMGIVDSTMGRQAINKIANTLLTVVPRGPGAVNSLWPHFTKSGGTLRIGDSEWASGDTAYALNDLAIALQIIGDPDGYLPSVIAMYKAIDWASLLQGGSLCSDGYYSHGYQANGTLISSTWSGWGAETMWVNFAALVGGGPLAGMASPPSDNGCGFIPHAAYPMQLAGIDRYGNDWYRTRLNEVQFQVNWCYNPDHYNRFLIVRNLFGLSAAETPDATAYAAYGIGGRYESPNDGGHAVVTPHYSGMIAALDSPASVAMLASLESSGYFTPLNNVDSLAVDPSTGLETVNWLKGSWNLALFCEGWELSDTSVARTAYSAARSIPEFARAFDILFPRTTAANEAIVVSDGGQNLIMIDPSRVQTEQVLTAGAPFTEPMRPSVTQSRLIFDAKPVGEYGARIYSSLFTDLGLGIWQQHTADPWGSSQDWTGLGQFTGMGISFISSRTGTSRRDYTATGCYGPGYGEAVADGSSAGTFSKRTGWENILFLCPAQESSEFLALDVTNLLVVPILRYSNDGSRTLAVERVDTTLDQRLLFSTYTNGLWIKRMSDGALTQALAFGRQASWNSDGTRIAFILNNDVWISEVSAGGLLTNVTQITATPDRDEQWPVWVPWPGHSDIDTDGIADDDEAIIGTDPLNPDTDGDGMPDGYEIIQGFSPVVHDAVADTDGDGFTDLQEYLVGTNPHDEASYPTFARPVIAGQSQLPAGIQGVAYAEALFASSAAVPWSWSVVSNSLPPGLSLNPASGLISGIPNTTGTAAFRVRCIDGNQMYSDKTLSLTINANHEPVITSISASNSLLNANGVIVVPANSPVDFAVEANDLDGQPLSYAWTFCDGTTNGNAAATRTFTNCGTCALSVAISDGQAVISSNLTVAVPCDMNVSKLQTKLNFAKPDADRCSINATMNLDEGFSVTNKLVILSIGGVKVAATLDAKGQSVGTLGKVKLVFNKKMRMWMLTAKLRQGSWQTQWATYGLASATIPKPGVPVTMPVIVAIGDEAFTTEKVLNYRARAGKLGNAD